MKTTQDLLVAYLRYRNDWYESFDYSDYDMINGNIRVAYTVQYEDGLFYKHIHIVDYMTFLFNNLVVSE